MSEKELEDKEFMAALDRMCLEAQQSSTKAMKSDIAMPSVSVSRNTGNNFCFISVNVN